MRRHDVLSSFRQAEGMGYGLLCNSIYTARGVRLEEVVGDILWHRLSGDETAHSIAELSAPVPVLAGEDDRVELDENMRIIRVQSAEPTILQPTPRTTLVPLGAAAWQSGRCIGRAITEVFASVSDGQASPLSDHPAHFMIARSEHVAT